MPTTVISFLGTGQKLRPEDSRSAYRTTVYRFSLPNGQAFEQKTSLFGTALVRYLQHICSDLQRWVVLGTAASLWSELNQILPYPDAVLEQCCQIDDLVAAKSVDEASLQAWQQTLNAHGPPLELRLCLISEALDPLSQQQVARALFANILKGDEVIFDISHGFRHLPVIATFVISLMRWTHSIRRVRLFSGVFEARQGDDTPVIELPICQRLVEATEAAAILELTGNYAPLARWLGLEQDAELAWFLENTNQLNNARAKVKNLREASSRNIDPLGADLIALLRERLRWVQEDYFAERVRQSALEASKHGDYLRAIVLIYEALLLSAGRIIFPTADPLDYQTREDAETELFSLLSGADRELLADLQHTRNACAHGTRSNRASVQQILQSPEKFVELIARADDLFNRLSEILRGHDPSTHPPSR